MEDDELTRLAFSAAFGDADLDADLDMRRRWSPLTDDGDAFRLAVALNLLVLPYPDDNAVRVTRLDQPDTIVSWGSPPDALAATRRAIVRAAAEMAQR
jgi:hypothetical protein